MRHPTRLCGAVVHVDGEGVRRLFLPVHQLLDDLDVALVAREVQHLPPGLCARRMGFRREDAAVNTEWASASRPHRRRPRHVHPLVEEEGDDLHVPEACSRVERRVLRPAAGQPSAARARVSSPSAAWRGLHLPWRFLVHVRPIRDESLHPLNVAEQHRDEELRPALVLRGTRFPSGSSR